MAYVNTRGIEYLGKPLDELTGYGWAKCLHPDDVKATVRRWKLAVRLGVEISGEFRLRRASDGAYIWHIARAVPLRNEQGEIIRWYGTATDIHSGKQAEEVLRNRNRQQRLIAEFGQMALREPDLQSLLDRAAKAVTEALGDEYCKVLELLPGGKEMLLKAGVGWRPGLVGSATAGTGFNSHAGYTLQSNHPVIVDDLRTETRFTPPSLLTEHGVVSGMSCIIPLTGGQPWGVIGTHTTRSRIFTNDDVSFLQAIANILGSAIDRKHWVDALARANETLEQRVWERTRELEDLNIRLRSLTSQLIDTEQRERRQLAQVIHDHLQQLLVAARMRASAAHSRAADPSQEELLETTVELLGQSIEVSRSLTTELRPPVLYEAGLAPAFRWLAGWMEQTHGLKVELDIDSNADPEEDQVKVLLFESARELMLNTVKYAGVDRVKLSLKLDQHGNTQVEVQDSGCGFDVAVLEENRQKNGGFGLFNIRERLWSHGGEFHIESSPGVGTTVRLSAPASALQHGARADEATDLQPASQVEHTGSRMFALPHYGNGGKDVSQRAGDTGASDEHAIKVVIADDHNVVREGIVRLLVEQDDMRVVSEARNGEEALDAARRLKPDLMILDVNMPKMTGIEAARAIKQEMPEITIVGLSIHAEDAMVQAMLNAGASSYVTKDAPADHLLSVVRRSVLNLPTARWRRW